MSRSVFERVLITGGTGFIGRYVLERLIGEGIRPLVTSRRSPAEPPNKFDIVQLDLTDRDRVDDVVSTYRPQAVIHLAGVTGGQDPSGARCHDVNATATKSLLAVLERTGCERVVMIGSASEYGTQTTPFREDMLPFPASPYGRSKAEATSAALEMHSATGFPVTVLRVFTAYGPGQPHQMFVSRAITSALKGERFEMTDGSQRRDLVYVEDVADAIVRCLYSNAAVAKIINIGGGEGLRLSYVAEKIWELCHADKRLLTVGRQADDPDSTLDTEADITLAKEVLDWAPQTPLLNGLSRTIGYMSDRR